MKNVDEITVGANGSVYVAPPGSTVPANVAAALDSDWTDLGYTSEDGVTLTDAKTLEAIPVWQLFYPARRIVTERDLTVAFALRQFGGNQVELAFGGGTVEETTTGFYKFTPPSPEVIDERMLAIEWTDGDKDYRLVVVRGMVTENVETNIVRSAAMDLPITFGIIGDESGDPWNLYTNDPAFADAVGS